MMVETTIPEIATEVLTIEKIVESVMIVLDEGLGWVSSAGEPIDTEEKIKKEVSKWVELIVVSNDDGFQSLCLARERACKGLRCNTLLKIGIKPKSETAVLPTVYNLSYLDLLLQGFPELQELFIEILKSVEIGQYKPFRDKIKESLLTKDINFSPEFVDVIYRNLKFILIRPNAREGMIGVFSQINSELGMAWEKFVSKSVSKKEKKNKVSEKNFDLKSDVGQQKFAEAVFAEGVYWDCLEQWENLGLLTTSSKNEERGQGRAEALKDIIITAALARANINECLLVELVRKSGVNSFKYNDLEDLGLGERIKFFVRFTAGWMIDSGQLPPEVEIAVERQEFARKNGSKTK